MLSVDSVTPQQVTECARTISECVYMHLCASEYDQAIDVVRRGVSTCQKAWQDSQSPEAVAELGFPAPMVGTLERHGLIWVRDLTRMSREDLIKLSQMAEGRVSLIERTLAKFGKKLKTHLAKDIADLPKHATDDDFA